MIDFHCDTILLLEKSKKSTSLYDNPFSVDIKKLLENKSMAQFFALFIDLNKHKDPWAYYKKLLRIFNQEMNENQDYIEHVDNYSSFLKNDKISAFLTVEDGGIIGSSLEKLEQLYKDRVRLITLTWNYPNAIGFPNVKGFNNQGLTQFGFKVIEKMNHKGMLIDVSHLSDAGFWDVINHSKKPIIASHSNARAVTNHPRNLDDSMLKAIGENGGVVGINFCPSFISETQESKIKSIVKHMKHIVNKAGLEAMVIGTDFDGIKGPLEIDNISKMDLLRDALLKSGFKNQEIEKIWHLNAKRIIREVL